MFDKIYAVLKLSDFVTIVKCQSFLAMKKVDRYISQTLFTTGFSVKACCFKYRISVQTDRVASMPVFASMSGKALLSKKVDICCPQVIFQVALTILDNNKEELLNCKDDGEAMPILSSYLENVGNRDTTMPTVAHTTQLGTSTKKEVKFTVACKAYLFSTNFILACLIQSPVYFL